MTNTTIESLITSSPSLPRPTSTESYWQIPPHPLSTTQSPSLPTQTHHAIIGSGITGLSVSLTLLEHDPDEASTVTVLEARTLCSGATGRNGGQLAANIGEEYTHLARVHGSERAGQIAEFTLRNLERMRELAEVYKVREESEVQDVEKLRVFLDRDSFERFKESVKMMESDHPRLRGLYTVIDAGGLKKEYNIDGAGGALLPAGTIWPYRLVTNVFATLLDKYKSRFRIETLTAVNSVTSDPAGGYMVHTLRGTIHAEKVAYCTNGYTGHLLPRLRGPLYPFKGTMTVQDPGSAVRNRGKELSWGFHYPGVYDEISGAFSGGLYYLLQNARTGYLFFGGEETKIQCCLSADDDKVEEYSVNQLREKLPRFLGEDGDKRWELISAWSGVMGFSADGLPVVGQLPASVTGRTSAGEFIAAAFNGYGMANCLLCGEALALMMVGKPELAEFLPDAYRLDDERLMKMLTTDNAVKYFQSEA